MERETGVHELDGTVFMNSIRQAQKTETPVMFYTWYGAQCPVREGWAAGGGDLYDSVGYGREALGKLRNTNEYSAQRCGPCYKVMRSLNDTQKCSGAAHVKIFMVAWSAIVDEEAARNAWKKNYDYAGCPEDIISWVWFGDPEIQEYVKSNVLDGLHEEEKNTLNQQLQRGRDGKHLSAIITGKELLALLLRACFGGMTADTTVLPAAIGGNYQPYSLLGKGERKSWAYSELTSSGLEASDGWSLLPLNGYNEGAASRIARGLREIRRGGKAAGPTQNRNLGGVVYEGQPKDYSPRTGYEERGSAVVTYDYRYKWTEGLTGKDGKQGNLDLVDVFLNYTADTSSAVLGLRVFLRGISELAESEHDSLLVYNAFRGPATLSAAMTEVCYEGLKPTGRKFIKNEEAYGRTLVKTGDVVTVEYHEGGGYIYGHFETRNPTPDQIKNGENIKDPLGAEGYMVLPQVGLVKVWSGSWKAPLDYAVAITHDVDTREQKERGEKAGERTEVLTGANGGGQKPGLGNAFNKGVVTNTNQKEKVSQKGNSKLWSKILQEDK